MDMNQELRSLVRQAVMEEINNLGVRAAIKERISDTGLSDTELRQMVNETVDSYIRSVLGTNEKQLNAKIEQLLSEKINRIAEEEVKKIIGGRSIWKGSEQVESILTNAMRRIVSDNFQISVTISQKARDDHES